MQFKNTIFTLIGAAAVSQAAAIQDRDYGAQQVTTSVVIVDVYPAASPSIVYVTSEVIVLSCPASVTDCPLSGTPSTLTSIIAVSTTECPLTLTSVSTVNITASATASSSTASVAEIDTSSGLSSIATILSTTTRTGTSTVTIESTLHIEPTSTIYSTAPFILTAPSSIVNATLASSSSAVDTTIISYAPTGGVTVGPVTTASGTGNLPTATNGTVSSPLTPSMTLSPYVGAAIVQDAGWSVMVVAGMAAALLFV
ncbi:Hypothetical protein R9X50_00700700 [Acrodontium crateriforme]|uniref:Uncharacterized protein n=1 Tax=Acrodontium crateriforme TaxID=150365 RepID=A0AAQ3M8X9_9PEZI|nr:Hypothetical protein R9X50_00700700 [Acrodontium crateriforme]